MEARPSGIYFILNEKRCKGIVIGEQRSITPEAPRRAAVARRAMTVVQSGPVTLYGIMIPSRRLVIVRRGEDRGSARFDIARFTVGIDAALR